MVVPWQPSTGPDQTTEYEQEVENFLSSGQTTREAIQAGLEFLRARYEIRQPHSSPPEQIEAEIERRIATAKEALKKIREDSEQMNNDEAREQLRSFHLNSMQFAVFMIAPLGDLKSFVRDSEGMAIHRQITNSEALMACCMHPTPFALDESCMLISLEQSCKANS